MDNSIALNYFKNNLSNIILGFIIIITLLVIFAMLNIDFNPLVRKSLKKVVTIEPMSNNFHKRMTTAFCDKNNLPHVQEKKCEKLNRNSCNATSCCIWLSNNTCVAGNESGPTFHGKRANTLDGINVSSDDNGIVHGQQCNTIDGKKCFTLDYYYFKSKCFNARGKCPSK